MNASGKTIGEFLDSIMTSDFIKKLIPKVNELDTTMAKLVNDGNFVKIIDDGFSGNSYQTDEIKRALKPLLERLNTHGMSDIAIEANKIVTNLNDTNISNSIDSLKELGKNNEFGNILDKVLKKSVNSDITADTVKSEMNRINYYANIPKAYFNNSDSSIKKARIQGAIGGYAAVSVGGRFLNGGTLTTDSYGRKNIAGIPFI